MEIYSVWSSQSLHYKNNSSNAKYTKGLNTSPDKPAGNAVRFQVEEAEKAGPDYTAITPGELRDDALQSYHSGLIDQDTYSVLAAPLPMHAIDASGNILDLTGITDATSFNFADYYRAQLDVASSIGDPQTAETLQSVVAYLSA